MIIRQTWARPAVWLLNLALKLRAVLTPSCSWDRIPFQPYFIAPNAKYIQVDIDGSKFGRRHTVDLAVLADAKKFIKALERKG